MEGAKKKPRNAGIGSSTGRARSATTQGKHLMIVNRRCLRVMWGPCPCSSIKPEIFQAFIELPQALGIIGDGLPSIGERALRLVAITHHHIRTHQPQPPLDIVAILLQSCRKTLDHAAD